MLKENKKFLYLIQASSDIPNEYKFFLKRDFILLSYKEKTKNTHLFFPNSTWTTGRNELRRHVIDNRLIYDYYIFLDEDVKFVEIENSLGFNRIEKLLIKYAPFIANPFYLYYPFYPGSLHHMAPNKTDNKLEEQKTINFDGIYNCFSKKAFFCNKIFPYDDKFDKENWRMSQKIMIKLCERYYNNQISLFNIKIKNLNHCNYPKENIMQKVDEYINEKLK
jgi:hypothetical protein